jgi:hypothetical protein
MMAKKVDHSKMKLGRKPAKQDKRTLHLHHYLKKEALPELPEKHLWGKKIPKDKWGMMGNNKLDDCTIASAGHLIIEWTSDNGKVIIPKEKHIISAYSALSGYNPKTKKNNKPVYQLDVLKYWRKKGIAGHKIMAFTKLKPKNHEHIKLAVYMFGGCYTGLDLPLSAAKQSVWKLTPAGLKGKGAPGSWQGHSVAVIGYDEGGLTCITWGAPKRITWAFWDAYCEETYSVISHDFAKKKGSPSGFDLDSLLEDLKRINNEE